MDGYVHHQLIDLSMGFLSVLKFILFSERQRGREKLNQLFSKS